MRNLFGTFSIQKAYLPFSDGLSNLEHILNS
jgi:hypothetical protein